MKTIKKNSVVELVRDIDCTNTGGPFMPQGTKGVVKRKKMDGTVLVYLEDFRLRWLNLSDVK